MTGPKGGRSVSFDEALTVFLDPLARTFPDTETHAYEESQNQGRRRSSARIQHPLPQGWSARKVLHCGYGRDDDGAVGARGRRGLCRWRQCQPCPQVLSPIEREGCEIRREADKGGSNVDADTGTPTEAGLLRRAPRWPSTLSQFNREYRRFFGNPPKRDIQALLGHSPRTAARLLRPVTKRVEASQ